MDDDVRLHPLKDVAQPAKVSGRLRVQVSDIAPALMLVHQAWGGAAV
jgi:hypothetical protein